jgi:nucleoside-diphosphate-sugar epimerase
VTYLVTGANGFIGKHLCKALSARGDELLAVVRPGSNVEYLSELPNIRFLYGTMEQHSWLNELERPLDAVFHLALNYDRLDPEADRALLDKLVEKGTRRFIYFSSICAAGLDLSPQPLCESNKPLFWARDFYGQYKWQVEEMIRARAAKSALDAIIIRPTIVYGPGERANLFQLFEVVRKGNLALWDHGRNLLRFCYIGNLIEAALKIAESNFTGVKTYHVGDLECPSLGEMCELIAEALGMRLTYSNHSLCGGRSRGFLRFVTNRFQLTDSFATHFNFDRWTRRIEADISQLLGDLPNLRFTPVKGAVEITAESYLREGVL